MADKTFAFELRAEFDPLDGAAVNLPDGSTFDVKKALDSHKGRIVTDDPVLAQILAGQPELKAAGGGKPNVKAPAAAAAASTAAAPGAASTSGGEAE